MGTWGEQLAREGRLWRNQARQRKRSCPDRCNMQKGLPAVCSFTTARRSRLVRGYAHQLMCWLNAEGGAQHSAGAVTVMGASLTLDTISADNPS